MLILKFVFIVGDDDRLNPKNRVSQDGFNVTLLCTCDNEVTWSKKDDVLPPNIIVKFIQDRKINQLTIVKAVPENSGVYICEGEDFDHLIIKEKATVTVSGAYVIAKVLTYL